MMERGAANWPFVSTVMSSEPLVTTAVSTGAEPAAGVETDGQRNQQSPPSASMAARTVFGRFLITSASLVRNIGFTISVPQRPHPGVEEIAAALAGGEGGAAESVLAEGEGEAAGEGVLPEGAPGRARGEGMVEDGVPEGG